MGHDGPSRKGLHLIFSQCSTRFGFSICTVDTNRSTVPNKSLQSNNKYAVLANDKTEPEDVQVNLPTSQIKILPRPKKTLKFNPSVKKNDGPTIPVSIPSPPTPRKEEMSSCSWKNTVDPWSTKWMKQQVVHPDIQRNICHLKTFIHDSRTIEVSLDLMEDLCQMSPEDAYWTLKDLQGPPRFRKASVRKSRNSLELPITIITNDETRVETKALIDSGCTGSSIHKDFVKKYGIQTHNLPCLLKVYNADGTHNAGGQIEKFVIIQLQIKNHKEQIGLAVTDLGPNSVFLGHNWLKMHNPAIDWKTEHIKFRCKNDHIPQSVDEEDKDEDFSPSQGDRLYRLDSDEYICNVATEVAIKDFKQKKKKKFEEVAPEYVHEYKDVFAKESFDVLPPRRPWDHAIELLPSDHEIDCKVYPLNPGEQKKLDKFLAENLKSGRI